LIAIEKCVRLSIRDAVSRSSRKPFAWGGLAGYAQLEAIAETLRRLPIEPETAVLRQWLPQVERALDKNRRCAQDVREAQDWLHRIADCLRYPGDASSADHALSSTQIRCEMEALLAQFQPDPHSAPAQAALQRAWQQLWSAWSGDLLSCYEVPGLPADNLGLEAFFNRARNHERRVSGRSSTRPLGVMGQYQVLFLAESEQDLLTQLRQVPREDYQAQRRRLAQGEATRQHLSRLHHKPGEAIQRLLDQHASRRAILAAAQSRGAP
jgi:hypothetical protein